MNIKEIKNLQPTYMHWTCIIHCPVKAEAERVIKLLKNAGFDDRHNILKSWDNMGEDFSLVMDTHNGFSHDSLKDLKADRDFRRLPLFQSTEIHNGPTIDDIMSDLDQRILKMEQRRQK